MYGENIYWARTGERGRERERLGLVSKSLIAVLPRIRRQNKIHSAKRPVRLFLLKYSTTWDRILQCSAIFLSNGCGDQGSISSYEE